MVWLLLFSYWDYKTIVDVQVGGRSMCYILVDGGCQWIWPFHAEVVRIAENG